MSDSEIEAGSNVQRDALGIVVFALATFASISVGMSIWRPVEVPSGALPTAVAAGAEAIGVAPLLCFTLGLTLLGAGTWLFSRAVSLRDCAGLLGSAIGLSVLLGAVTADAGGAFGALSGGKVTAFLSYLVGVPFGLACLLLPAWLAWGRAERANSWNLGQDSPEPAVAPASEVEGVSPAEAEALLPRVPPRLAPTPPPPSPYPPDVRLQGRIPEGAKPIYFDDDSRAEALPDPDLEAALLGQPSEGLEAAAGPARAHLARPDAATTSGGPDGALREDRPAGRPAGEAEDGQLALRTNEAAPALEEADPPRPTWEQPNLFGEEAVDAYGTPLSILRSHRGDATSSPVVDPPDVPLEAGEVALAERALADLAAGDDEQEAELALAEIEEDESEDEAKGEDEEEDEESGEDDGELVDGEDELVLEDDASELEEPELEETELEETELGLELAEEETEAEEDLERADAGPARGPLVAAWEAEPEAEADESEAEPQLELVPQPAPAAAAPLGGPSEDLVRRAAALFLERQRVAVSLLQREFDLDFEQSTAVLDRLQAQGLIGPYLGGQRREILLSAGEWERRCASK